MSQHDTIQNETNVDADDRPQFVAIEFEDDGCLIYDRENSEAWVQAVGEESVMENQA